MKNTLLPRKPSKLMYDIGTIFYNRRFNERILKVDFINTLGELKPPYIVLANHSSIQDFKIAVHAMYPRKMNFIVGYDQLQGLGWVLNGLGCLPKRQFAVDIMLIKQIRHVIERNKGIVAIYPEGKLTSDGRTGVIAPSIGKLVKLLAVPVVIVKTKGAYLSKPKFNRSRLLKNYVSCETFQLLDREQIDSLDVVQIFDLIKQALSHDEYAWQRECKIEANDDNIAEGLHHILYNCPHCDEKFSMNSSGKRLYCEKCGASYSMDKFGVLTRENGQTAFDSVDSWYDFLREQVRGEILSDCYYFEDNISIKHLYDYNKGYVDGGSGVLTHSKQGFSYKGIDLSGNEVEFVFPTISMYSLSYDVGKHFLLHTQDDTMKFEITQVKALTMLNIAVEELYKIHSKQT